MGNKKDVQHWRNKCKNKLIESMGGRCNRCGYCKYYGALDFHHLDQSEKSFTIASALAGPKNWKSIIEEAKKCVLLCKICHAELHGALWDLSEIEIIRCAAEEKVLKKNTPTGRCGTCGCDVFDDKKFCGVKCAGMKSRRANRPSAEELRLLLWEKPTTQIAVTFGVSAKAVEKWAKGYRINKPPRGYWQKVASGKQINILAD